MGRGPATEKQEDLENPEDLVVSNGLGQHKITCCSKLKVLKVELSTFLLSRAPSYVVASNGPARKVLLELHLHFVLSWLFAGTLFVLVGDDVISNVVSHPVVMARAGAFTILPHARNQALKVPQLLDLAVNLLSPVTDVANQGLLPMEAEQDILAAKAELRTLVNRGREGSLLHLGVVELPNLALLELGVLRRRGVLVQVDDLAHVLAAPGVEEPLAIGAHQDLLPIRDEPVAPGKSHDPVRVQELPV